MDIISALKQDKELSVENLVNAYRYGYFPMGGYDDGRIRWYSPDPRGIIPLDDRFHIPHGLKRVLRKNLFEIRVNTAFRSVIEACASRDEVWIDQRIMDAYCRLHASGFAHSLECWDNDGLQGGLYGVSLGKAFFGESMFSRKTDASKIALVNLVSLLRERGGILLDTQWVTDHLKQFGAFEVPATEYKKLLEIALRP